MHSFFRVSVIGLGYIGLPTAAVIASRGVEVLGVDVAEHAVNTINQGKIHIVEPDLDMLVVPIGGGGLLSGMGTAARGLIEQMLERFEREDRFWLGIAPEGTRTRVERWKPGFWHIARNAGVPVVPAYFDYANKVIGIGPAFELTDDMHADIARIQRWYKPFKGRNHDVVQPKS